MDQLIVIGNLGVALPGDIVFCRAEIVDRISAGSFRHGPGSGGEPVRESGNAGIVDRAVEGEAGEVLRDWRIGNRDCERGRGARHEILLIAVQDSVEGAVIFLEVSIRRI